jgi:uncharacterized protein (TIGR02145 family)
MQRLLHLVVLLFISINLFAQAPQKMTYQAVIRNASNNLVVNSPVKMKISILQGSANGTAVFSELHNPTTNANGLVSIEIGSGTSPVGTIGSINWGNGTYFLKTETDPTNGTNYSIVGTSQLLSVPYALQANCVSSSLSGDTLSVGCRKYLIPGIIDLNTTNGITSHTCGATDIHNPQKAYGTISDQEGNKYKTIQIGNQTWMAENLRTTKYRNGITINNITDNTQWQNTITGAYCDYENKTSNICPFGRLYNWYAVTNINQLCPSGWHVPSTEEWTILETYLGGNNNAGIELKSTGNKYWQGSNTGANNNTGFSALPGGYRIIHGEFYDMGARGYWWTSSQINSTTATIRSMYSAYTSIGAYNFFKTYGFSIRCVKD